MKKEEEKRKKERKKERRKQFFLERFSFSIPEKNNSKRDKARINIFKNVIYL